MYVHSASINCEYSEFWEVSFHTVSLLFPVDDFTPGPYEVTFPANQTSQVLNIPITDDELLEADTNDFEVLIVNFTSNCSIRSRSPREVLVQILDEDSKLCGPVDGTHSSDYMHWIVLLHSASLNIKGGFEQHALHWCWLCLPQEVIIQYFAGNNYTRDSLPVMCSVVLCMYVYMPYCTYVAYNS